MTTPSVTGQPFYLKQHDTAPAIATTLTDPNGKVVVLTGASITFTMSATVGGTPKVNRGTVTILNATAGTCQYQWLTGDTNALGSFYAEWEVVFPSGNKETYPGNSYNTVIITQDLDGV